jgi:glycosyltransferase involved in cell wall biosynthesis
MFMPRVRKMRLKRVIDGSVLRWLPQSAAAIVVTSEHERRQILAAGGPADRVVVRGNGFPTPGSFQPARGALRDALGVGDAPLVLYVGRIAAGKGVELLLETVRRLPGVHLALVGPDDGHGVSAAVEVALRDPSTRCRIHRLQPSERPLGLYGDADVFVLPSAGESFGMVAAEAAAAGTPVVVTDQCGVAEWLGPEGALVVPYDLDAICSAVRRVLDDSGLRARLVAGGQDVARRLSWPAIAVRQEEIYRDAVHRGG